MKNVNKDGDSKQGQAVKTCVCGGETRQGVFFFTKNMNIRNVSKYAVPSQKISTADISEDREDEITKNQARRPINNGGKRKNRLLTEESRLKHAGPCSKRHGFMKSQQG
jgi:hypothetical protein